MTDYERIRNLFNATTTCRHGERPRLEYDPGCLYIECAREDCKCRMADGEGGPVSPLLIEWKRRHTK